MEFAGSYETFRTFVRFDRIYKTQLELIEETGLTRDEQRTARKALKAKGLLHERYDRLEHQLYFQVQMEAYNAMIQGIYDAGEGDEDGPKPWKINEIRKTYMGKYGNRIWRDTEIVSRHIRKPSVAVSEIPSPVRSHARQKGTSAYVWCEQCSAHHQPNQHLS